MTFIFSLLLSQRIMGPFKACVLVFSAVCFVTSTIAPELLNFWTATLVFKCTQAFLLETGWHVCRM